MDARRSKQILGRFRPARCRGFSLWYKCQTEPRQLDRQRQGPPLLSTTHKNGSLRVKAVPPPQRHLTIRRPCPTVFLFRRRIKVVRVACTDDEPVNRPPFEQAIPEAPNHDFEHMHVLLADELIEALRDVTPPYDEEEEIDEDRAREVQARRELEDDGCPPCYPPDLDFPLLHPPTSVEAIVRYWQFPFGTNSLVLCAQRSDWEGFRAFHRWMRQRHRTIFGAYEDKTRKRRARHGLRGSFCLLPEAERQNRRENWVEFQAYQLGRLEKMERERDALEHNLDEAQQKAQDGDAAVSKRGEEDADAYLHMLRVSKRDMDRHEVLLQWIEQRRLDMDRADAKTSGAEEAGDGARRKPVEGTDARVLRARQPKTPPVLGKARVSKAKKRPNAQRRSPHRNCYGYEVWAGIKTAKQMGSQRHGREIEAVGS